MYKETTFIKVELNEEIGMLYQGTINSFLINLKINTVKFVIPQTSREGNYPVYYTVENSNNHYTYNGVIYSYSEIEDMTSTYREYLLNQKSLFESELLSLKEDTSHKKKLLSFTLESINSELSRIQSKESVLSTFSKANNCLSIKFHGSLGVSDIQFFKDNFTYLLNQLNPRLEIKSIMVSKKEAES